MREILFRGFTPDENGRETITVSGKQIKGEWVQGSYWELRETTYCFQSDYDKHPDNTKHYIVFDRMTDWGLPNRHLQADVIPETVGQFTGLTDKNGKKIFEGDVVKAVIVRDLGGGTKNREETGTIGYDKIGMIGLIAKYAGTIPVWSDFFQELTLSGCIDDFWFEVIGNIHDNPELLEVTP